MKKLLSMFIAISILFLGTPISHAEEFYIDAPSYMLLDLKSGQVLCEKDSEVKLYPASTTKIMTAILALEKGSLDQIMTANEKTIDPGRGGMNIGIMAGEKLTMEDLLNALLIKSANETANIIAENIGGTMESFIDMMNAKALEIGANSTHYVTTNGMHDDNHYTTARDMAKITLYAMRNKYFRDIVKKSSYTMHPTNKHSKWDTLNSTNKLFYYESDYFSEVTGIKTGYTSQAGNNLISSARNDKGMELVALVFGVRSTASSSNVYALTEKLLEYGFQNFSEQQFVENGKAVDKVRVTDAKDDKGLDLILSGTLSSVLPNDQSLHNIEASKVYTRTDLKAPIKKGDKVGYMEYKRQGLVLGRVDIIASTDIEKSFKAQLRDDIKAFLHSKLLKRIITGAILLVAFFFLLRITLKRVSRAMRSKRRHIGP